MYYLRTGRVTRIGGGAAADLRLGGLEPVAAEIRCDEADDEYHVVSLGPRPCRVDGAPVTSARLWTGTRIELGGWTLV